jgi:hypothetical protein
LCDRRRKRAPVGAGEMADTGEVAGAEEAVDVGEMVGSGDTRVAGVSSDAGDAVGVGESLGSRVSSAMEGMGRRRGEGGCVGGGAGLPTGGLEGHRCRAAASQGAEQGLATRRHGRRRERVPSAPRSEDDFSSSTCFDIEVRHF